MLPTTVSDPESDEDRAEEERAARRGSARALLDRFKREPIELRRFAGPEEHHEALDHVRVAHLTDMHFGRVTPERIQREAIRLTNDRKPDVVVITGDFVCHSQMYLDQLEEVLRGIDAPVYGVLGNHDYWSGAKEVLGALHRAGVEVLRNQHTTISVRGQKLQLVGLDDAYTGHADREAAVKGLRPKIPSLGLSHIAEEADWLWTRGVPLVLAGHTHAGQVTLARLHELAVGKLAGHKYIHGLYGQRRKDEGPPGTVYVGAGIGAAVMPLRFGERGRREVTIFELGHALGSIDEHHDEQAPLPGRKPSRALRAKRQAMVARKAAKRRMKEKKRSRSSKRDR